MKIPSYYTKLFFEDKKALGPEKGHRMHELMSKVNFEPDVKLVKSSYDKKTMTGEFKIKVGDCHSIGFYGKDGKVEFRTSPGDENRECFELTKSFENLLSNKFSVIMNINYTND
jgi:hypothetical protein